jgi:transposase-like protein
MKILIVQDYEAWAINQLSEVIKNGFKHLKIFTKLGWHNKHFQKYQCTNCKYIWHNADLFGMFEREVITQAIYMYLRSLSLNSVSDIFRSWFDVDFF